MSQIVGGSCVIGVVSNLHYQLTNDFIAAPQCQASTRILSTHRILAAIVVNMQKNPYTITASEKQCEKRNGIRKDNGIVSKKAMKVSSTARVLALSDNGCHDSDSELVLAVPSRCHEHAELRFASEECIIEAYTANMTLVGAYIHSYCCGACNHKIQCLVQEFQNASSYRVFCVPCWNRDTGVDWNTQHSNYTHPMGHKCKRKLVMLHVS